MPEGTKVEKLYKKLLSEGHSEESAARIAQSQTGLSLQTGKPPKGRGNMQKIMNGWNTLRGVRPNEIERILRSKGKSWDNKVEGGMVILFEKGSDTIAQYDKPSQILEYKNSGMNSFQNGQKKAIEYIQNKARAAGVKVKNTAPPSGIKKGDKCVGWNFDKSQGEQGYYEDTLPNGDHLLILDKISRRGETFHKIEKI